MPLADADSHQEWSTDDTQDLWEGVPKVSMEECLVGFFLDHLVSPETEKHRDVDVMRRSDRRPRFAKVSGLCAD
jgi:hypothetical protein